MAIRFDTSGLRAVVQAFEDATGGPAMKDVEAVVFKGATNIKKDAARRISGHPHLRGLPSAIDFDMYRSLRGPAAEVGPNKSKAQGPLGNIPEYGTVKNAPTPYMAPSGEAEEPKFAKAIEELAVKRTGLA